MESIIKGNSSYYVRKGVCQMKESKTMEFKADFTKSFLKTVSAFSNYEDGQVIFGIDDSGNAIGIANAEEKRIDIENMINDSISPHPDYIIELNSNEKLIILSVKKGENTPYFYKGKAYKRNDTATIEVDPVELSRLILEGRNICFEETRASEQNLSFDFLEKCLKEKLEIENFNQDTLRTLSLYGNRDGYNKAAELLADKNTAPGIDIAIFGENINTIKKRVTYDRESVLIQYEKALQIFKDYYEYEEITGAVRKTREIIPEVAFREVIANAIVHRTWDIRAHIKVSMFDDRIEISSPGGLPVGINKEEYIAGNLSVVRNSILANVFHRLGLVEIFGTGILRINNIYKDNFVKPVFEVYDNSIKVILPVIKTELDLTNDQKLIYNLLSKVELKSISEIQKNVSFGKSKTLSLLKEMAEQGYVKIKGRGRGTKYHI